jgi:RNA polymerase sigma factor (sigma-70 family)
VKIWNNNAEVLNADHIKYYLITATRNGCISLLRRQAGQPTVNADQLELHASEDGEKKNEEDLMMVAHKALSLLPPQCLAIFKLSRFARLTYQQIADEMGLSIKTVENQMGKAIKILKEYAKQHAIHFAWLACWLINYF